MSRRSTRSTRTGTFATRPGDADETAGHGEVSDLSPQRARAEAASLATGDAAPCLQQCSGGGASVAPAVQKPASLGAGPSQAGDGQGLATAGPAGQGLGLGQSTGLTLTDATLSNIQCCSKDADAVDAELALRAGKGRTLSSSDRILTLS